MKKIGLTGGIATGKSNVARCFATCGAAVVDADYIVHDMYANNRELQNAILRAFGPQVLTASGTVDRNALGAAVIGSPEQLRKLESLVHPRVREQIRTQARDFADRGFLICILDIPLLFESGGNWDLDSIVVAYCSQEEQLLRIERRYGCTREEAEARTAIQLPLPEKIKRANFIIDTNGSPEETQEQTRKVYAELLLL